MHVTKKTLSLWITCLLALSIQAQTSLNLYPINGAIGFKFRSAKKVALETRFDVQLDIANGESNLFMNTELLTLINFIQEEKLNLYTGIGLGANIYNQAQSSLSGTVPFGLCYYFTDDKRLALIGEGGLKITAGDFLKLKSYALIGLQIGLRRNK